MIVVTKVIEWDMGHRIPNHKSKCKNIHGHRYRLEASIIGTVIQDSGSSDEGMVYDFSDFKDILMKNIHDVLDHGFMWYNKDKLYLKLKPNLKGQKIISVDFIPTAENIIVWCRKQIKYKLPTGVRLYKLKLFETPNSWAELSR